MELAQWLLKHDAGVDVVITGSAFSCLTTFGSLPHSNCLVDEGLIEYDIAIIRAPFKTAMAFRSPERPEFAKNCGIGTVEGC